MAAFFGATLRPGIDIIIDAVKLRDRLLQADLCITGGVHSVYDICKSVMVGASAVQIVSALLVHGPEHLGQLRKQLARWLETHEYESLQQMRGARNCAARTDARTRVMPVIAPAPISV